MLPPLPKWPLKPNGFREGGKLNQISDRIQRQSLISSKTILITDTDRGQTLDNAAAAGAAGMLNLGFAVTKGATVQVAAGKVVCSSWTGIDGNDPEPADWAVESTFTGAILASTVSAVWLQIQFTDADEESEGALGTESVDVSGSAGGRGGGGGGGGAANGDTSSFTVEAGSNAQDGQDGGAGGAGGRVLTFPGGVPVGGLGESEGGDGGTGGAGGDGGDGTSTTFTRATKSRAEIRRWSISGISAHSSKGTASDNATWVKLATITSGDITQHHVGILHVSPPLVTYIAS